MLKSQVKSDRTLMNSTERKIVKLIYLSIDMKITLSRRFLEPIKISAKNETIKRLEVTVQRLSSVKISLLATSILFQASAKFNCTKGLELLAVN